METAGLLPEAPHSRRELFTNHCLRKTDSLGKECFEQIDEFLAELKAWAATHRDPLLRFSANPEFEERFEPLRGALRLESDWMRYDLQTVAAKDPQMLSAYRIDPCCRHSP